jgi:hypothetical protein
MSVNSVLRDSDGQWPRQEDGLGGLNDKAQPPAVTSGRIMTCNGLLDLPDYVPPGKWNAGGS